MNFNCNLIEVFKLCAIHSSKFKQKWTTMISGEEWETMISKKLVADIESHSENLESKKEDAELTDDVSDERNSME